MVRMNNLSAAIIAARVFLRVLAAFMKFIQRHHTRLAASIILRWRLATEYAISGPQKTGPLRQSVSCP